MPEPCVQENSIGRLEATTEQIGKTLERLSSVLEKIAAQGTRVDKLEKDNDEVFNRLRVVELSVNTQEVKMGLVATFTSIVVSAITAFMVKHFGSH